MRRWGLIAGVMVLAGAASIAALARRRIHLVDRQRARPRRRVDHIAPRPQATIVFDRHGKPAFSYFVEQRIVGAARSRVAADGRTRSSRSRIGGSSSISASTRCGSPGRPGGTSAPAASSRGAAPSPSSSLARRSCRRCGPTSARFAKSCVAARLEERYTKAQILEE